MSVADRAACDRLGSEESEESKELENVFCICKKPSVLLFLCLRVHGHVHHCVNACSFPRKLCMHESLLIVVTIFSLFFFFLTVKYNIIVTFYYTWVPATG